MTGINVDRRPLQTVTERYPVETLPHDGFPRLAPSTGRIAAMTVVTMLQPVRQAVQSEPVAPPFPDLARRLAQRVGELPLHRRAVRARQVLFHGGQPTGTLYLVHAGFFKTTVASADGREKITGFRLRGDLLGMESIGLATHACDAVALDTGEVWELPLEQLQRHLPECLPEIAGLLASEIRRDWRWMLDTSSLNAEQRVAAFLLDLGERLQALGFSRHDLRLRMTRADLGNFLSLQLETVTRALSRLAASGLIDVDGREIRLADPAALMRRVALAA
ncbi:MAG TPA: helix-turn-helix domain-containing protein [Luteimonas sp.]|nr:helix-turn-helix domain-containing protein [Luteimonas sp.]